MNALPKTIAFIAVLLTLAACTPLASGTAGPSTAAEDEAAIRTAGKAWDDAYKSLNADALAALYAADAVLMPETARTAKGEAAIRQFLGIYVGLLAEGGYQPLIDSAADVEVSGDLAIRSGTYAITDKSGMSVDTGKWLETWRKTDGQWRISRDIWNSDNLPLFPPMAYAPPGGAAP